MKTSLNRLRGRSILDPRAASAEQLFLAPPFTEEVAAAIRLISTRLPLKADEDSRLLWQRESNAASEAEYDALLPLLQQRQQRVIFCRRSSIALSLPKQTRVFIGLERQA